MSEFSKPERDKFFLNRSLLLKEAHSRNLHILSELEELGKRKGSVRGVEGLIYDYLVGSLYRITNLTRDTLELLEGYRPLSASMTARGVFETVGILSEFIRQINAAMSSEDIASVVKVIRNYNFASKEFEEDVSIKTPHVLDGIRKLDKKVKGVVRCYDILCEVVHPNWSGRNIRDDDYTSVNGLRLFAAIFFLSDIFENLNLYLEEFSRALNNKGDLLRAGELGCLISDLR